MTKTSNRPAPPANDGKHSVFDLNAAEPQALSSWAERLSVTNLGESSQSLFETLERLNDCPLEPKLRYQLLEVLRPVVYNLCNSLASHYHSQPIVLPPQAYQIYQLTQDMQRLLVNGYQIAARESTQQGKRRRMLGRKKAHELSARAIHRAMSDMTRALFRSSVIYTDCGPGYWSQMHNLYRYALAHDFQQQAFQDLQSTQACELSIEQNYLKALLLGSVRSNQLRQEDLSVVFDRLEEWVTLVELAPYTPGDEDQIAVDLNRDDPPVYEAQFAAPEDLRNCRLLVLDRLLYHLSDLLSDDQKSFLSRDLIKHLLISWGSYTTRTFMRMDSSDCLAICVGLPSLHFFAADGMEFEDLTREACHNTLQALDDDNPFLRTERAGQREERDIWNAPFRPEVGAARLAMESIDSHIREFESLKSRARPKRSYDNYDIRIVNVSPGGYGLQWPSELFTKLSNGDVVGIRETKHNNWSVGVVSWMRREGEDGTQLGVKLLGSSVVPYGARQINSQTSEAGEPDYHRVLLMPAIKLIGQPATLITPQRPFRANQNLLLVHQGRELRVHLSRLISTTGAISQFEIEYLDKPWQEAGRESRDHGKAFTSLRKSL